METHLITSENDEHSDNEVTSQKSTNEKDSTDLIKPIEIGSTLLRPINEPQQLEVKPSTSAQAVSSPPTAKTDIGSTLELTSSRISAKDVLLDTKNSNPRGKKKKGFILCMNRVNAFLFHFLVPLSLLICKCVSNFLQNGLLTCIL